MRGKMNGGAMDGRHLEEWVFAVDPQTGTIVKIEQLEQGSGRRTELTPEQYALVASIYGVPIEAAPSPNQGIYPGVLSTNSADPFGYLTQGMNNPLQAGGDATGLSPDAVSLSAYQYYTTLALAYYQGYADAQVAGASQ